MRTRPAPPARPPAAGPPHRARRALGHRAARQQPPQRGQRDARDRARHVGLADELQEGGEVLQRVHRRPVFGGAGWEGKGAGLRGLATTGSPRDPGHCRRRTAPLPSCHWAAAARVGAAAARGARCRRAAGGATDSGGRRAAAAARTPRRAPAAPARRPRRRHPGRCPHTLPHPATRRSCAAASGSPRSGAPAPCGPPPARGPGRRRDRGRGELGTSSTRSARPRGPRRPQAAGRPRPPAHAVLVGHHRPLGVGPHRRDDRRYLRIQQQRQPAGAGCPAQLGLHGGGVRLAERASRHVRGLKREGSV
jgi:hypothetical protein